MRRLNKAYSIEQALFVVLLNRLLGVDKRFIHSFAFLYMIHLVRRQWLDAFKADCSDGCD